MCCCDSLSLVSIIKDWLIPILTLSATICIPKRIHWEQMYSSLLDDYRSLDYANAFQGVIQFFVNECGNDVERIKTAYKKRFIAEVETKSGSINKDNCLHFQRRILAQFFWQLNLCSKSIWIGKRRVMKDFTSSEANLLKILIYMGYAIDGDSLLYKDISSLARVKNPAYIKGLNKSLGELYHLLKKSNRFITS